VYQKSRLIRVATVQSVTPIKVDVINDDKSARASLACLIKAAVPSQNLIRADSDEEPLLDAIARAIALSIRDRSDI